MATSTTHQCLVCNNAFTVLNFDLLHKVKYCLNNKTCSKKCSVIIGPATSITPPTKEEIKGLLDEVEQELESSAIYDFKYLIDLDSPECGCYENCNCYPSVQYNDLRRILQLLYCQSKLQNHLIKLL